MLARYRDGQILGNSDKYYLEDDELIYPDIRFQTSDTVTFKKTQRVLS